MQVLQIVFSIVDLNTVVVDSTKTEPEVCTIFMHYKESKGMRDNFRSPTYHIVYWSVLSVVFSQLVPFAIMAVFSALTIRILMANGN